MAEKRGQYVYLEDGSVALQTYAAGGSLDSSGGSGDSTSIVPMDHQATLVNTAVTHTNVAVAPSGTSAQSAWVQVPEGMTEFIQNLNADAGFAGLYTIIQWSEDGTNASGKLEPTVTNTLASSLKTSEKWYPVGGAWYKASIWNGDAAPHTCSANIKFRP